MKETIYENYCYDDLLEEEFQEKYSEDNELYFEDSELANSKNIKALKELSFRSKCILKNYCTQKNTKYRTKKIIEFLKCLDWVPFDDIDKSFFCNFNKEDQKILIKDVNLYLNKKQDKLNQTKVWRESYKERIWDYFKKKVPPAIKKELEELRDFELNLIEHDRNWQHYFSLNSFKKIDEFIKLSKEDRHKVFKNFQKDVYSYKINRDRNLHESNCDCESNLNWEDEFIRSINWEKEFEKKCNNSYKQTFSQNTTQLTNDYATLGLPHNCDKTLVKKQFRKLAQIYHPDKSTGNPSKMKNIIEAYQRILK